MRHALRLAASVAGLVVLLGPAALAQRNAPNITDPHVITTGTGEARVTPDRAAIFIGVQTRAATAAAAASDNARRQRAVLDTLRALGLASEQVSTQNYSVTPEMQYSPNGQTPPKVTGYVVANTVRADLRRLEDVGRVLDAALAKGANNISGLQFYFSKADSARRAALAAAVADARADAEAMAKAAGGSLGALSELSSETSAPPRPMEMQMLRAAAAPAPTQIEPGQQVITATVTGRWWFVPGR